MKSIVTFMSLMFIAFTSNAASLELRIQSQDLGAFVQVKIEGESGFRIVECASADLEGEGCQVTVPEAVQMKKVEKAWLGAKANKSLSLTQSADRIAFVELDLSPIQEIAQPAVTKRYFYTAESEKDYELKLVNIDGGSANAGQIRVSIKKQ